MERRALKAHVLLNAGMLERSLRGRRRWLLWSGGLVACGGSPDAIVFQGTGGGSTTTQLDSGLDGFIDEPAGAGGFACQRQEDASLAFEPQRVDPLRPRVTTFYSWTTDEQREALRAGGPIFSVGEVPGLGRGLAMDLLHVRVESELGSELERALAAEWQTYRYAWGNPWATRLGAPGESYGSRLIAMRLKPDAWIARLGGSGEIVEVYDLEGQSVSLEVAALSPERIGALYFIRDASSEGPACFTGTFSGTVGSGGYREFILGNPSQLEEWSLETAEIRARLESDVAALRDFLARSRACPDLGSENFDASVTCAWTGAFDGSAYVHSLALPSELYAPTARNLVGLIETLEADLFTPDPFVVTGDGSW